MNHSQSQSNASANGGQDADSERTDPTRLSLPYVDTSMRYEGYRLRPFFYGIPGYLGAFLVVVLDAFTERPFLYFFETTGAFLLLGGLCTVYGIKINEELTSPADHFRSLIGRVLYRQKYPLGYARLLADPIHNVDRISLFQNHSGVAEMTDGRYVAAVHVGGQHTEHKDGEQLDTLARNLTSSIRSNMDSDFNIHITTFDTNPEEFLQSYRDAVHSDRFAGSRWRWVREILWDILDYEHREAEQWDAREQRTYLFVSVSPGEVSGHRKSAKTTSVFGGGDAAIRHKQMRRQLRKRVEAAVNVGHTGEDSSVTVIGPSELALLLSNYYSGTEHALNSDERVANQLNASVWPPFDEYEKDQEQTSDQSHQPPAVAAAVDNRELDPRGGVADVAAAGSEAEAASGAVADGGTGTESDSGSGSETPSRPVQSTTTVGTPEAIGEQSTAAANSSGDGTR